MGLFDTTSGGAATGYPGLLNQARRARQIPRPLLESPQQHLDLATGLLGMVPGIGDAVGLAADVNRYKNEPETRTWGNYGLSALGLLPFVPGITVWHGSPHKFDKFDASNIGKGEGAQAYGHGTYLAESKKVAKEYAETLGKAAQIKAIRDTPPDQDVIAKFSKAWQELENKLEPLRQRIRSPMQGDNINALLDSRDNLVKQQDLLHQQMVSETVKRSGVGPNIYKADLPDEWLPKMLDWDKPLSQQAPEVQASLEPALKKAFGDYVSPRHTVEDLLDRLRVKDWKKTIGPAGGNYLRDTPALAAAQLRELGIPGIRYLDGNSRNAGQGTYNYVVFPGLEDQVKILSRE